MSYDDVIDDFRMPDSYFEPDPETDEDPDFAYHALPACPCCKGRGGWVASRDEYGNTDVTECPCCEGDCYMDPREAERRGY